MRSNIEINGHQYLCFFSTQSGGRAPRENGQPISPDESKYIDDLSVIAYTLKGNYLLKPGKMMNKVYEKLMENL